MSGTSTGIYSYSLATTNYILIALNPFPGGVSQSSLLCYSPGSRTAWILNAGPLWGSSDPYYKSDPYPQFAGGIANVFDLSSGNDKIIGFDYSNTGYANELLCYRPGSGICYIERNTSLQPPILSSNFSTVYQTTNGIGTGSDRYDLSSVNDKIAAYDIDGNGKPNALICYRSGSGVIYIFRNNSGVFQKVY